MQVTERHLRYFTNEEFVREGRNWLPMYNPRLLLLLDVFRHLTGTCILSPHKSALGRISYPKNPTSKHVYDSEDGVRAVDCFPYYEGELTKHHVNNWVRFAKKINLGACGIYPQWNYKGEKRCGIHLDVRESERFVTWSYFDNKMYSIEDGLKIL